jgi:hypothetical protein
MEVDGGTRQSMRVSSGSIFEKEFAKKLRKENPNAIVERGVRVEESERKTKYHKVDIVLIDKQASKVVQYELKSQKGIPHTNAGEHKNHAQKMRCYGNQLKQMYGCDNVDNIVVRRGGYALPEHTNEGIITEKLEKYFTQEEIAEIDWGYERCLEFYYRHAGEEGLDLYDDDKIVEAFNKKHEFIKSTRDSELAKKAYREGQNKNKK